MKNSLLYIFVFLSMSVYSQTSVPNTTTFTLQDVYNVVHSHASSTTPNLQSCFDNSVADYFDPAYGSKTMNPKTLYGFRNYTISSCSLPYIIANSCGSPTDTEMQVSATISSDGGCTVTSRGFQYSTDNTFTTIIGSVTSAGTGTGQYYATITGLTPNTHYYFRPWATNAAGTYYGNSVVGSGCFTLPSVLTHTIGSINYSNISDACFFTPASTRYSYTSEGTNINIGIHLYSTNTGGVLSNPVVVGTGFVGVIYWRQDSNQKYGFRSDTSGAITETYMCP